MSRAVPLRTLFTFHVPEQADGDLEDLLGASSEGEHGPEASNGKVPPTRRATMLFLTEATSVLEYLRVTRGPCISAGLLEHRSDQYSAVTLVQASRDSRTTPAELQGPQNPASGDANRAL